MIAQRERQQLDIVRDGLSLTLYVSYETEDGEYLAHPTDAHPIARVVLDHEPPDWSVVSAWLPDVGNYRKVWLDGFSTTPGRIIWPFDGTWMGKRANYTFSVLRGAKASPTESILEIKATDEGERPYAYQPGDGTTHLVLDHFSGGSGTQADPYLIENITELQAINDTPGIWGSYFRLANDIDASATSGWNAGTGWLQLCRASPYFYGQLSGYAEDGVTRHTISDIWMNRGTMDEFGLVGRSGSADTIIEGIIITGTMKSGIQNSAGAFIGYGLGTIRNCKNQATLQWNTGAGICGGGNINAIDCENTGTITCTKAAYGISQNGAALRCINRGNIVSTTTKAFGITYNGSATDCQNFGNVTANTTAAGITETAGATRCSNHGSITGVTAGGITLTGAGTDCYNTGTITSTSALGSAGGIRTTGGADTRCFNAGIIRGNVNVGGIFGDSGTAGNSTNSFSAGLVEGTGSSPSNIGAFGGLLRSGRSITAGHYHNYSGAPAAVGLNEGTGSPTAQATAAYFHTYSNAPMSSWDFVTVWDSGPSGVWFPVLKNQGAFIKHLWRPVIVDADGPVVGATVTLVDAQGVTQASYVTDASGLPPTLIYLPETSLVTSPAFAITTHTPYTVTAAATGYTALPAVIQFTADMRGVLYLGAGVLPPVGSVALDVPVGKLKGTRTDCPVALALPSALYGDPDAQKQGELALAAKGKVAFNVNRGDGELGTRTDALAENSRFGTSHGDPDAPINGRMKLTTANNLRLNIGIGTDGMEVVGDIVIPVGGNLRAGIGAGSGGTEVEGDIELASADEMLVGAGAGSGGTEVQGNVILPPKAKVLLNEPLGPSGALLGELVPVRLSERVILQLPKPLRLEVIR